MAIESISVPAASFVLPGSNGPRRITLQNDMCLSFDDTTEQTAYSPRMRFTGYAAGTLTATLLVSFETEIVATDEAVFAVSVEAVDAGDALDIEGASGFDPVENTAEVDPPGTVGYPVECVVTLTDNDDVAEGDWVRFKLARKVGAAADTATDDARVWCMEITEA